MDELIDLKVENNRTHNVQIDANMCITGKQPDDFCALGK